MKSLSKRLRETPKIEFHTNTIVKKFVGENKLSEIEIENLQSSEFSKISLDAVLIRIGVEPNTKLFKGKFGL